jgi:hypothetical protein
MILIGWQQLGDKSFGPALKTYCLSLWGVSPLILEQGRELTPPRGVDLSEFFAKADALKSWIDAINITESPRARMAVEPKSVGHLLQDRGIT